MPWRHKRQWMYGSTFLDLSTDLRWVVNFMPRPLYPPGERAPGTHWIGGYVDPRTGLGNMEKRKFLPLPGLKLWPLGHPAHSQLLYQLCCPGSHKCSNCNKVHNYESEQSRYLGALAYLKIMSHRYSPVLYLHILCWNKHHMYHHNI
jgi:hypothetical protein